MNSQIKLGPALSQMASRRKLLLKALFLPFSLLIMANKAKRTDRKLSTLLDSGKVIVLTINSVQGNWSERYADWSEYLNTFGSQNLSTFEFVRVDTAELSEMIRNANRFTEPYSMLFMKKGKDTLFYPGCIVEPQVYQYVQLYYSGRPIPKNIEQFAPQRVDVQVIK